MKCHILFIFFRTHPSELIGTTNRSFGDDRSIRRRWFRATLITCVDAVKEARDSSKDKRYYNHTLEIHNDTNANS